jgi:hypothetical protein
MKRVVNLSLPAECPTSVPSGQNIIPPTAG